MNNADRIQKYKLKVTYINDVMLTLFSCHFVAFVVKNLTLHFAVTVISD